MRGGKDWIQTFTGKRMYPFDPDPESIVIEDIAHSLSMQCRFGGQCRNFYSVSEHCVHVAALVPDRLKLAALLHDASEAYIQDLVRPIKHMSALAAYREAEDRMQAVILTRFGLPVRVDDEIKAADEMMLRREAETLHDPLDPDWSVWLAGIPACDERIWSWSPERSCRFFMSDFYSFRDLARAA